MRKVSQVMPTAIGQSEVLRAARAQTVLRRWEEVVGAMLATKSRPDRYSKGTVWVAVEGSAWAQELRMRKDAILERLREMAGEPSLFQDVRFGVRQLREPDPEIEHKEPSEEAPPEKLSIREIAQRRLAKWPRATGD